MHTYAMSRWALPAGGGLVAIGAALLWVGLIVENAFIKTTAMLLGAGIGGLGIALLAVLAVSRARQGEDERKAAKYGCDQCGYVPRPEDMEEGGSFPCPTCGRPLYPK